MTCSGIILAMIAFCYKSKCRHIKCCGCEVERDVRVEEEIDEMEMNHNEEHKV